MCTVRAQCQYDSVRQWQCECTYLLHELLKPTGEVCCNNTATYKRQYGAAAHFSRHAAALLTLHLVERFFELTDCGGPIGLKTVLQRVHTEQHYSSCCYIGCTAYCGGYLSLLTGCGGLLLAGQALSGLAWQYCTA